MLSYPVATAPGFNEAKRKGRFMTLNRVARLAAIALVASGGRNWANAGAARPSGILLTTAIKALRQQENAVQNIGFMSRYRADGTYAGLKGLVLSQRVEAKCIYGGLPRGRYRIEVFHDIARWTDGPGAFSEDIYAAAYNGRVSTYLKTGSGTRKKIASVAIGKISGSIPRMVSVGLYRETGWNASIFGFTSTTHGESHPRFSAYINPAQRRTRVKMRVEGGIKYVPTLHADWKVSDAKRYLRVVRVGTYGTETFLLDPRKGFSIVQYAFHPWLTKKTAAGFVLRKAPWAAGRFSVSGFSAPRPHVFFPRSAHFSGFAPKAGKPVEISEWSVKFSKVQANAPAVTNRTYVVAFPQGAVVHDTDTGQSLQVGGTAKQQLREIEQAVRSAR